MINKNVQHSSFILCICLDLRKQAPLPLGVACCQNFFLEFHSSFLFVFLFYSRFFSSLLYCLHILRLSWWFIYPAAILRRQTILIPPKNRWRWKDIVFWLLFGGHVDTCGRDLVSFHFTPLFLLLLSLRVVLPAECR